MTQTQTPQQARPARKRGRVPTFGLSAAQVIGTALAAVTATFAASYLGVYGTVIGAGLVSFLTATGGAVYTQSIRRTGKAVREAVPITIALPIANSVLPADREQAAREDVTAAPVDEPPSLPAAEPRPNSQILWRRVAFGTLAIFVTVLAAVTVVEVVVGRPISDIVRGDSGSGTSLFGNVQTHTKTVPATPTVTVTITPKVTYTTPTVTETAPATTVTPSGSGTTASTASTGASASRTPSSSATRSATQSATPSGGTSTP